MKIISSYQVEYPRHPNSKEIRSQVKQLTGFEVRRMDNFSLIALQTVYYLLKDKPLSRKAGLYGVANYFSVELLQSLILSIEAKQDIRPFDFISTVGNAANFHLAKQFNISGPNLFLGASKNAIMRAKLLIESDLSLGLIDSAVLVHWLETEQFHQCEAQLLSLDH